MQWIRNYRPWNSQGKWACYGGERERMVGTKGEFKWFIVSSNFRINIEVIFVCYGSLEEQAYLWFQASSLEWDDLNSIVIWICSNTLLPRGELRVLFFPPQFYYYHIWVLQNLFTQHHGILATQISKASVSVLFSLFVYTYEYIN